MIFKPKLFYRTSKSTWLFKSDRENALVPAGRFILTEMPQKSLVMFAKKGRLRYIKVLFKDLVGFIWMPLNVPTHLFMELADLNEDQDSPGPFVRPSQPSLQKV